MVHPERTQISSLKKKKCFLRVHGKDILPTLIENEMF